MFFVAQVHLADVSTFLIVFFCLRGGEGEEEFEAKSGGAFYLGNRGGGFRGGGGRVGQTGAGSVYHPGLKVSVRFFFLGGMI